MSNVIMTSTGSYFPFENPESHNFDIKEIAWALSNLCRYTGHVSKFYSVAQHSVWVSRMVPPELALAALMHDASEAYLGDVASPLKRLLPDYKLIEERVERAICAHFGLPFPLDARIKEADLRMLMTERRSLLPADELNVGHWPLYKPYDFNVEPLQPVDAHALFLERYEELKNVAPPPEVEVPTGRVLRDRFEDAEPGDIFFLNGSRYVAEDYKEGGCSNCAGYGKGPCNFLPGCSGIIWLKKN
jgi:hypothetical protein